MDAYNLLQKSVVGSKVKMKAIVWKNEDLGAEWEEKDIPSDLKEISEKYRQELVETAVEQDEKNKKRKIRIRGST